MEPDQTLACSFNSKKKENAISNVILNCYNVQFGTLYLILRNLRHFFLQKFIKRLSEGTLNIGALNLILPLVTKHESKIKRRVIDTITMP